MSAERARTHCRWLPYRVYNKSPPFKGLNVRIPIIIPIKGRGFMNQGSRLGFRVKGYSVGVLASARREEPQKMSKKVSLG